ncbi:Protease 2 [Hordeum vulgare]|nr:Protease 2 [Hordeum vulgare]
MASGHQNQTPWTLASGCQPPTIQANEVDVVASEKVIQEDGDGDADVDLDDIEEGFHGIDVGDLDAYIAQKEIDHELPFRRLYGHDLDDEVLEEELDEDGFTKEENRIHFELTGLEKKDSLVSRSQPCP